MKKQTLKFKDINNLKINLYIGLKTNKGKKLNKRKVLKLLSSEFIKIGVSGFNISSILGFWDNKSETSILLSFFNTFGVKEENLLNLIKKLNLELKQDCILLEYQQNPFSFI